MAAVQRVRVLGAYKQLISAAKTVFGGDSTALSTTRAQARAAFAQNADKLVAEAADATDFLRSHVVQAALNEEGRYEMKLQATHAEGADASTRKIQVQPAGSAAESATASGGEGGCCGGGCT